MVNEVSTIAPYPASRTVVPQFVIVTVFDPAPFGIVTVPLEGVRVVPID